MSVTNRSLESPDETRKFDHGQVQVVKIGESTIGRYTFEPGWRWSESVKPIANTDSCQAHHVGYILSGRLHVKTDDGGEAELGAGEAYAIHPGHDGVRMAGPGEQPARRSLLDDATEIQDGRALAETFHHREVVRDEHVGELALVAQTGDQSQDA